MLEQNREQKLCLARACLALPGRQNKGPAPAVQGNESVQQGCNKLQRAGTGGGGAWEAHRNVQKES